MSSTPRRTFCRVASRPGAALLAVALHAGACDGGSDDDGGPPSCVSRDASACMPLYEPRWERVFTETVAPRCGTPGTACHAVEQGDAACSEVVVRLDIDDDALRRPPGTQPLDEAERCAVARWIADGAAP